MLPREPGDALGEIGALQLHRRDVDGDRHQRAARLPPAHRVLDRPLQHEVPDRHHQAGLFRDAHEALGPHVPMARVLPAQQRLQRHDVLRFDIDDRLIVHVELPALQRGAQARLDGDALLEPAVHAGAEDLEVVAAAVLRLVHRRIGVPQQLAHVDAIVRIQRHADTHGRHQRAAVHDHGRAERLVDALGGLVDLPGVLHALQYDHELIPTHAHHDILGAHGRANALRDGLQELVAGLVSARIVDVLEAIEIQEQHREHAAGLFCLFEVARQVGRQIQPIGEPGELIVVREVIQLLMALEQLCLGLAAQCDVVDRHPEQLLIAECQPITVCLDVAL